MRTYTAGGRTLILGSGPLPVSGDDASKDPVRVIPADCSTSPTWPRSQAGDAAPPGGFRGGSIRGRWTRRSCRWGWTSALKWSRKPASDVTMDVVQDGNGGVALLVVQRLTNELIGHDLSWSRMLIKPTAVSPSARGRASKTACRPCRRVSNRGGRRQGRWPNGPKHASVVRFPTDRASRRGRARSTMCGQVHGCHAGRRVHNPASLPAQPTWTEG